MRKHFFLGVAGVVVSITWFSGVAWATKETVLAHVAFGNSLTLSKVNDSRLFRGRPLGIGRYILSTSGAIFRKSDGRIVGSHVAGEVAVIGVNDQTLDILATNYKPGNTISVSKAVCRYAGGREMPCALTSQISSSKGLPLLFGANIKVHDNMAEQRKPAQFDLIIAYN